MNKQVTTLERYSFTLFFLLFVCKKTAIYRNNMDDVNKSTEGTTRRADRSIRSK